MALQFVSPFQETVKRINKADSLLDMIHKKGHTPEKEHQMQVLKSIFCIACILFKCCNLLIFSYRDLVSTEWKNKIEIQQTINEKMKDTHVILY